ncbi:phage tail tape measure protein [Paenibacillus sp. GCM10027626]|uniref:phage tail tape measure protein n=1 Tax=Paenibacillus sp. GCM10027626 TaxID=3273411 RepID=UPI003633FFF7
MKVTAWDKKFAVTSQDIANSLQQAGQAAKSFGVDIDQVIGHSTAIMSLTKESGTEVGDGLSKIYSRVATAPEAKDAFKMANIDFEQNGSIRKAGDLIADLAAKWSSLSDTQRENIGLTLAGEEHYRQFTALMLNYNTAVQATEAAVYSNGSASRENAEYMQSLQGRIDAMKASWQEFSLALGNSALKDALIILIELGTNFINNLTMFTEKFGKWPAVLGIATTAVFALTRGLQVLIQSLISTVKGFYQTPPAATAATGGVRGLTVAVNGLKLSIKGLLATTGIGLLLVAIGTGVEWLIGKFGDASNSSDDLADSFTNLQEKSANLNHLQSLSDEYSKYKDVVSLTADEKIRLSEIENELQQTYGINITSLNENSDAYSKNNELIQDRINLLDDEYKREQRKAEINYKADKKEIEKTITEKRSQADDAEVEYEKALAEYNEFSAKVKANTPVLGDKYTFTASGAFNVQTILDPAKDTEEIENMGEKLAAAVKKAQEKWESANEEFASSIKPKEQYLNVMFQDYIKNIEQNGTKINNFTRPLFEALSTISIKSNIEFDAEQLKSIFNIFNTAKITSLDDIQRVFDQLPGNLKLTGDELAALKQVIAQVGLDKPTKQGYELKDAMEEISKATNNYSEKTRAIADEMRNFDNAIRGVTDGQILSSQAVQDLIRQYPELAPLIRETSNGWTIEKNALDEVRKAKAEKAIQDLENEKASTYATLTNILARVQMYGLEAKALATPEGRQKAYDDLDSNKRETIDININAINPFEFAATSMYNAAATQHNKTIEEAQRQILNLNEIEAALEIYKKNMDNPNYGIEPRKANSSSGPRSSGISNSNNGTPPKKEVEVYKPNFNYDKNEEALKEYNRQLQENQRQIDEAKATGQDYNQLLQNRTKIYENMSKELAKQLKQQEKQLDNRKKVLTSLELLDKDGNIVDKVQNKLVELSKKDQKTRLNYSMEQIETLLSEYTSLPDKIDKTKSDLSQAIAGMVEILTSPLDLIQSTGQTNRSRLNRNISLLGEINTEEEKKAVAAYGQSILASLKKEASDIAKEIARLNKLISSKKSTNEEKKAAQEALTKYQDSANNINLEMMQQAEKVGKEQSDATTFGFNKKIEDIDFQISLLGDSDEDLKKIEELNREKREIITAAQQELNKEITKLERKLTTDLSKEERQRITAKLEAHRESSKHFQQIEVNSLRNEQKARENQADAIIDNYKKMLNKRKELELKALQERENMLDEAHRNNMQRLDDELKKFEQATADQLKTIDRQDEEDTFEKERGKKQNEKQDIERKISEISLDDSIEAKEKRKELEKELADKVLEIEEFNHQRIKQLRKDALNDKLEEKRREIELEKETANTNHENMKKAFEQAREYINTTYEEMLNDEQKFHQMKQDLMSGDLNVVKTVIGDIKGEYEKLFEFVRNNQDVLKIGEKTLSNWQYDFNQDQSKLDDHLTSTPFFQQQEQQKQTREDAWKTYLDNKKEAEAIKNNKDPRFNELKKANDGLRKIWGFQDGSYNTLKDLQKFNTGGYTGDSQGLAWLDKKELVLNDKQTADALSIFNIASNIIDKIRTFDLNNLFKKTDFESRSSQTLQFNKLIHIDKIEKNADVDYLLDKINTQFKQWGFVLK